jgi:hypothetical protein
MPVSWTSVVTSQGTSTIYHGPLQTRLSIKLGDLTKGLSCPPNERLPPILRRVIRMSRILIRTPLLSLLLVHPHRVMMLQKTPTKILLRTILLLLSLTLIQANLGMAIRVNPIRMLLLLSSPTLALQSQRTMLQITSTKILSSPLLLNKPLLRMPTTMVNMIPLRLPLPLANLGLELLRDL